MSTLLAILVPHDAAERVPFDLEGRMLALMQYGWPRLSFTGAGWHCRVEMNTTTAGASFDVCSNYDHVSPREAVLECETRIANTLRANV